MRSSQSSRTARFLCVWDILSAKWGRPQDRQRNLPKATLREGIGVRGPSPACKSIPDEGSLMGNEGKRLPATHGRRKLMTHLGSVVEHKRVG